jgi:hypothetical protein
LSVELALTPRPPLPKAGRGGGEQALRWLSVVCAWNACSAPVRVLFIYLFIVRRPRGARVAGGWRMEWVCQSSPCMILPGGGENWRVRRIGGAFERQIDLALFGVSFEEGGPIIEMGRRRVPLHLEHRLPQRFEPVKGARFDGTLFGPPREFRAIALRAQGPRERVRWGQPGL